MTIDAATVSRGEIENFLYQEAALLDEWRLDEWLTLLTADAHYRVPPNDQPHGDPANTLFLIADDIVRLRARVRRLQDPDAHAEYPHSRTRRIISNVRVIERGANEVNVEANFIVYRFRRNERIREYVGHYRYVLRIENNEIKIAARTTILDGLELGSLGAVSLIL